jgi:hypothetical protein
VAHSWDMQVDRLLKSFFACGLRYAPAEKKVQEGRSISWKQPELPYLFMFQRGNGVAREDLMWRGEFKRT